MTENKVIYLDNNATTRCAEEVLEAMMPFFCERYGNPSSIHTFGGRVAGEVEAARRSFAELAGAKYRNLKGQASEIIFTSCGTESDSAAIRSAVATNAPRRRIVTTKVEHPAVLNLCRELSRQGYEIVTVGVDGRGRLRMDEFEKAVDGNTAVVSVMWANNETGTIFPVEELAAMAHARGALFHTDAVQAVGKIPMDLSATEIDFASFSGHKINAPKGIGALYVRRGVRFRPFLVGGHQESGRRGGTENVPYIVGLGAAARLAMKNMASEIADTSRLRDMLEEGILKSIPAVRINGDTEHRLPNTSSVSFEGIEGESILMHLDRYGICASSGSACTTGSLEPSHVLRAMGLPYTAAHGTIRFSFSRDNNADEVKKVLEVLPGIVAGLRELSPFWDGEKVRR